MCFYIKINAHFRPVKKKMSPDFHHLAQSNLNQSNFSCRQGPAAQTHKHMAIIHDLVVVPDIYKLNESSYNLERNMMKSELSRVRNFALLSENSNDTLDRLDEIFKHYKLSLFLNENEDGK